MAIKEYTDALTTLAKGTDAGLYRLIPEKILVADCEQDIIDVIKLSKARNKPLTFKAGGTSLSGQTISDSIIVECGDNYPATYEIYNEGKSAKFSWNITGERANRILHRYGRKIGPSPASIKSARIGGIVSNNASGSSYGIRYNSYNTIESMRIILSDGYILDTSDAANRQDFINTHHELTEGLLRLRKKVCSNPQLFNLIKHKYELKNTCGYGVNSLTDYEDPIDILMHLMIGGEGTLGFISEVTFRTVPDYKMKASALVFFHSIEDACVAIKPLRECSVSAAELMDRNALRSVENEKGMPNILKDLPENAAALLIDTSADSEEDLEKQFAEIENHLKDIKTLYPISFTTSPELYSTYWNIRNGLFTSAAAGRPHGTVSIIEDIAFRADVLGEALTEVRKVLSKHNYADAVMWGHLLDGNVHFTVFPDINQQQGVSDYRAFMDELVATVLKYDGSLKAEHGTGRNMANYVKLEWGEDIYHIMMEIKTLFDPSNILNPGVIINENKDVLVNNLKQIPIANELIDKCIECGFCEVKCPSRNLTLTPRQRIVVYRALVSMANKGETNTKRYRELKRAFNYPVNYTCATDGLCATACPVGINTGVLIKELRWKDNGMLANKVASGLSNHMDITTSIMRGMLSSVHAVSWLVGYATTENVLKMLYIISGKHFPLWTRYTPRGAEFRNYLSEAALYNQPEVVYFPSCITRTMGASADYEEKVSVTHKTIALLHKAGYALRYPQPLNSLCCGMAFSSKGFRKQAKEKEDQLNKSLLAMSDNGRLPVLCDMSPCVLHMKETLDKRLKIYEPAEFIHDYLLDRLEFSKVEDVVALHSTCSTTKMGIQDKLYKVASLCADKVIMPEDVGCCAWAGDRGFFYPELNSSALKPLKKSLQGAKSGYSNSRTCEIGLTMNSGISYKSIVFLVDKATKAK